LAIRPALVQCDFRPSRPHATADRIAGMSEPRKKPGVAFWATVVAVLPPVEGELQIGH